MGLGNLPIVAQMVSDWGRIGAQSVFSLPSLGRSQLSAGRRTLICFRLSSECGEALALPAIMVTILSPSVCFLTHLLVGATWDQPNFMKIIIKFINCLDLLENKTQSKLPADQGFGLSVRPRWFTWSLRSYFTGKWFLLGRKNFPLRCKVLLAGLRI